MNISNDNQSKIQLDIQKLFAQLNIQANKYDSSDNPLSQNQDTPSHSDGTDGSSDDLR
ncbi:hypothetical protein ACFQI7_17965 [Paenibacillus allorhizosphaerae]|uniref:DUF4025 domain-containing protein n=1 Tax=Paenibacillus allorhizosphaerae TaxID=2849866 RepID=A0ABM8VEU8_9BACL|nr:hypothetical protein [Paenibacillus allorhizosphaerae]CAG7632734.1 hypothetical protein PAECIP111802_01875 [Paenibacillus allorhizosphaerae]